MKGAATDGGMGGDPGTEKQPPRQHVQHAARASRRPARRRFRSAATETAKLERSSVDAFRERIKSCAMLPAGVSPADRVSLVIRIALKPDGRLAGQPTLIEASASPKGPAVLQSLFAGLAKCQPFNMLPADKYQGVADPRHPLHPAGPRIGVGRACALHCHRRLDRASSKGWTSPCGKGPETSTAKGLLDCRSSRALPSPKRGGKQKMAGTKPGHFLSFV